MIQQKYKNNFVKWIIEHINVLPDKDLETIAERIDDILIYDYYNDCVDEEFKKNWKESIDKERLVIRVE